AILDGLPHKEIGALLGIAPHSSSSQLTHAKAMLRRMIIKYRTEMGVLSIVGVLLLLWHGLSRHREEIHPTTIISENSDDNGPLTADTITERIINQDSIIPKQKVIHKTGKLLEKEFIADGSMRKDSISAVEQDSVKNDSIRKLRNIIDSGEFIAQKDVPHKLPNETHDWSLALAYTGSIEQNNLKHYKIPDPGLPDVEGPIDEIDVTEKTRHYMPLVIGLSVNKSLTSRWSVETGLRYTFLRSDFLSERELIKKETKQRVHYIGIPIKFNYSIVTHNGLSIYCQGGGTLDIPLNGRQAIWEYAPASGNLNKNTIHIHAPLQWSVEGGVGLQYHFTPSFSIYAEPSLRYYFDTGSEIKTIRQDKPYELTMPIGLRLMW
ncbi:MAG: PorT family protein, partial [Muribaculaceae bacterium]|nr:PorT family protein [Muribaculaceae bacterium]